MPVGIVKSEVDVRAPIQQQLCRPMRMTRHRMGQRAVKTLRATLNVGPIVQQQPGNRSRGQIIVRP